MEKRRFRIAIAQLNPISGDIENNYFKAIKKTHQAKAEHSDILLFSPLPLSGVVGDLAYNSDFMSRLQETVHKLAQENIIDIILTIPNGEELQTLHLSDGRVRDTYNLPFNIYHNLQAFGNETPATKSGIHLKTVGGYSQSIFTGGSLVINPDLNRTYQLKFFEEELAILDFEKRINGCFCLTNKSSEIYSNDEFLWLVLSLGLKDFTLKSGFQKVIIEMNGDINSTLLTALAIDSLGAENVIGIYLSATPNSIPETSEISIKKQCETLGIELRKISISDIVSSFKHTVENIEEANIISATKDSVMRALSLSSEGLLLSSIDKSEIALNEYDLYREFYRDFAPFSDVYKTKLYGLARWRNLNKPSILKGNSGSIILDDLLNNNLSLNYPVIDTILHELIESRKTVSQVYSDFSRATVDKLDNSLKTGIKNRVKLPLGLKITP